MIYLQRMMNLKSDFQKIMLKKYQLITLKY